MGGGVVAGALVEVERAGLSIVAIAAIYAFVTPLVVCAQAYETGFRRSAATRLRAVREEAVHRHQSDPSWALSERVLSEVDVYLTSNEVDRSTDGVWRMCGCLMSGLDQPEITGERNRHVELVENSRAAADDSHQIELGKLQEAMAQGSYDKALRDGLKSAYASTAHLRWTGIRTLTPIVYGRLGGIGAGFGSEFGILFVGVAVTVWSVLWVLLGVDFVRFANEVSPIAVLAGLSAVVWRFWWPIRVQQSRGRLLGTIVSLLIVGVGVLIGSKLVTQLRHGATKSGINGVPLGPSVAPPADPSTHRLPSWGKWGIAVAVGGFTLEYFRRLRRVRPADDQRSARFGLVSHVATTLCFAGALMLAPFIRIPGKRVWVFGVVLGPLAGVAAGFGLARVVALAFEHERWCEERRAQGITVRYFLPTPTRNTIIFASYAAALLVLTLASVVLGNGAEGWNVLATVVGLGFVVVLLSSPVSVLWAVAQAKRADQEREKVNETPRAVEK